MTDIETCLLGSGVRPAGSRRLPGHRLTILGYAGSNFEQIVRNMALAIRTPPDVVGGFVAMRFAALHPELVKRLLLLVSAHRFSPAGQRDRGLLPRHNRPWPRARMNAAVKHHRPIHNHKLHARRILMRLIVSSIVDYRLRIKHGNIRRESRA